jgi:hypothetical protein
MPCHHNLETYLTAYIEGAGLDADPKGPLFRTIGRGKGRPLTHTPLPQANAYAMIGLRAAAAGIATPGDRRPTRNQTLRDCHANPRQPSPPNIFTPIQGRSAAAD